MRENRYNNRFGSQRESYITGDEIAIAQDDDFYDEETMERPDYYESRKIPNSARMPNTAPRRANTTSQVTQSTGYDARPRRTTSQVQPHRGDRQRPVVVSGNQRLADPVARTEKITVQRRNTGVKHWWKTHWVLVLGGGS